MHTSKPLLVYGADWAYCCSSSVPYEKGSNFLLYLGTSYLTSARLTVDSYCCCRKTSRRPGRLYPLCKGLREYFVSRLRRFCNHASFDTNLLTAPSRGKSIRTPEWRIHLYDYFSKHGGEKKIRLLDSVDWDVSFIIAFHLFRHITCKPVTHCSPAVTRRGCTAKGSTCP